MFPEFEETYQFMESIFSSMFSGIELIDMEKRYYQIGEQLGYAKGTNISLMLSPIPRGMKNALLEDEIIPILFYESSKEKEISDIDFSIILDKKY